MNSLNTFELAESDRSLRITWRDERDALYIEYTPQAFAFNYTVPKCVRARL